MTTGQEHYQYREIKGMAEFGGTIFGKETVLRVSEINKLWTKNLSLHFACGGGSSFIACKITARRSNAKSKKLVGPTLNVYVFTRFYTSGIRTNTICLKERNCCSVAIHI